MTRFDFPERSLAADSTVEEIINRLVQVSAVLSSGAPLRERMEAFCEITTSILQCDRSTILLWDGENYRGNFSFGLPNHLQAHFQSTELSDLLVTLIEEADDFVVMHHDQQQPALSEAAKTAEIATAILCPISSTDGAPLAILTAGYAVPPAQLDQVQAQVLVGLASLTRLTLMADADHSASLRSLASRRELRLELEQSKQEVRRRISVEIHDDSMTKLTALHDAIASLARTTKDGSVRKQLRTLGKESEDAVSSLGATVSSLDSQCPSESTMAEALVATMRNTGIRAGWKTGLRNNLERVPSRAVGAELLQIATQALANADLHASAETVFAELGTVNGGTQLTISDDGIGFDPDQVLSNRFGLLSMRERAEAASGSFAVVSELGVGTVISVWMPDEPQHQARNS